MPIQMTTTTPTAPKRTQSTGCARDCAGGPDVWDTVPFDPHAVAAPATGDRSSGSSSRPEKRSPSCTPSAQTHRTTSAAPAAATINRISHQNGKIRAFQSWESGNVTKAKPRMVKRTNNSTVERRRWRIAASKAQKTKATMMIVWPGRYGNRCRPYSRTRPHPMSVV